MWKWYTFFMGTGCTKQNSIKGPAIYFFQVWMEDLRSLLPPNRLLNPILLSLSNSLLTQQHGQTMYVLVCFWRKCDFYLSGCLCLLGSCLAWNPDENGMCLKGKKKKGVTFPDGKIGHQLMFSWYLKQIRQRKDGNVLESKHALWNTRTRGGLSLILDTPDPLST